jgi:shikimate dehydrogenase
MEQAAASADFFESVEALEAFQQQAPNRSLYVILGDPIAHSLSPAMQNAAFDELGIDARYVALRVAPEDLATIVKQLCAMQVAGINVTIPHKQAIIPLLDGVEAQSEAYGAVNTVVRLPDGKYIGHNTDGPGLVRAVAEDLGVRLGDQQVLLLGAGGAGSALAVQCAREGCPRLVLANRTREKAERIRAQLERHFPKQEQSFFVVDWEEAVVERELREAGLLINATSVGLLPGDASVLPPTMLPKHLLVYDTLYRPGPTRLEAAARAAGVRAAGNGLSLLLHQGVLGFTLWTGQPAPVSVMRRMLEEGMTR